MPDNAYTNSANNGGIYAFLNTKNAMGMVSNNSMDIKDIENKDKAPWTSPFGSMRKGHEDMKDVLQYNSFKNLVLYCFKEKEKNGNREQIINRKGRKLLVSDINQKRLQTESPKRTVIHTYDIGLSISKHIRVTKDHNVTVLNLEESFQSIPMKPTEPKLPNRHISTSPTVLRRKHTLK